MDLYALLGVTRGASAGEIERAYRRLLRRFHPGVNPGDRAAADMFRQVQQAFDVLGDLERRRDYDRGAVRPGAAVADLPSVPLAFEGFDFSFTAEGPMAATFTELFADVFQDAAREALTPTRGADIESVLELSFRDALRGGHFPVSITRQERCGSCRGDGRVPRSAAAPCPACGGQGTRRWARGHMVFTRPCDDCEGSGRLNVQACRVCGGAGIQARSEVVTVEVPAGVEQGSRLTVPGRGNAGARGGPAGDLYLTAQVSAHPYLVREGRDLHLTLPVAVHEAGLGARVDVPTLQGPLKLRIPAGTPSGRQLRIPGHGVPASAQGGEAGDLIVHLQIVLPPVRDERSRELLREFGRLNGTDVREHLFRAAGPPHAAGDH